jgi:hypothetical protein
MRFPRLLGSSAVLIVSHGVLAQEQFTDKDRVTGSSMINARFDFLMLGGSLVVPAACSSMTMTFSMVLM